MGARWELYGNYWWWTYWQAVYPVGWWWSRVKETIAAIVGVAPVSLLVDSIDLSYHVHEKDYRWIGRGSGCDPYGRCGRHWYSIDWFYPYNRVVVAVRFLWWTLYHQTVTLDATPLVGYIVSITSG